MKRFSLLLAIALLASCGGSTVAPNAVLKKTIEAEIFDGFYTFGGLENSKDTYGYGVFVPKGFEIDKDKFEKQGILQVINSDTNASVSFKFFTKSGHTDAQTFLHRDFASGYMIGVELTDIENTKDSWTLPMIGREQSEFADGTFAKAHYDKDVEGQKILGDLFVYWFDQKESKAGGIGLVIEYSAREDDYLTVLPTLDLIRKSYFRLPSYDDMNSRVMLSEGKVKSVINAAIEDCQTRLFQIQNGQMPFACWETILTKYTPAFDDEENSFLVLQEKTPSGYLGHPKRQGLTVKPGIPSLALKYLTSQQ